MDSAEFWKYFTDIRVNIDRERAQNIPIKIKKIDKINELKTILVPWYRNGECCDVNYNSSGATPVTVGEVANNIDKWASRKAAILKYEIAFRSDGGADVVVPAYQLPADRYLLLDGSHRTVGLARAGVPFILTMAVLDGEPDPEVLPDLIHWQANNRQCS